MSALHRRTLIVQHCQHPVALAPAVMDRVDMSERPRRFRDMPTDEAAFDAEVAAIARGRRADAHGEHRLKVAILDAATADQLRDQVEIDGGFCDHGIEA